MKASFLRKRKMARGVLVLDGSLSSCGPQLRAHNFRVITLPAGEMDADRKEMVLCQRTFITRTPRELEYDVPVLEFSLIDASDVKRTTRLWRRQSVVRGPDFG